MCSRLSAARLPVPACNRAAAAGTVDAATAEKQISVLSRGLSYCPDSSQLLLAMLRAYAVLAPDAAALDAKWAGVLARQSGSWVLWREFLALKYARWMGRCCSGCPPTLCCAVPC